PFRVGRRAEPHDRLAASADGDGALCARPRGQDVARAHDDGDPAVARAAARQPDPDHLRAANFIVAAADVLSVMVSAPDLIESVEILQVDLPPKVVRTDAIQS